LSGGTSYTKSDTNPTLTDADFVIAVNISGAHDLAWNAIANQMIGSAYIQNGAIQNAKIDDLAVDTAKIVNLSVQTIKIAANAVTVPVSAYTAGLTTLSGNYWCQVQTLNIVTDGSPVFITCSALFYVAYFSIDLALFRDAVPVWEALQVYAISPNGDLRGFNFSDKDVPAGSHTYGFWARPLAYDSTVANRSMMAQCIKR